MTTGIELTVILTAHDETLVAGPTVASADAAITTAEDAGITVERLIALDRATAQTASYFHQPALEHWQKISFDEGDLGRVRNAIVKQAAGRFIAFLDADDLFSENWLREAVFRLRAAEADGKRAIAHPELNWLFDGAHSVFIKPDQDDPLFTPYHFYFMNYYDSLCMCPREAHLAHPYVHRDIPAGLSFQDWQFSIETMAAGWQHLSVSDTIIFKRRRDDSLVSESRVRRALVRQQDAMGVDQIENLGRIPKPRKSPIQGLKNALLSKPAKANHAVIPADGPPFWGTAFKDRVDRARARQGNVKEGDLQVYKEISQHFDHAFYLACNEDIAANESIDPVAHYIRAGWREGRNPVPHFSNAAYLEANPDVKADGTNPFYHWLTKGKAGVARPVKGFDVLAQAIGQTPKQALALWKAKFDDLQNRLGRGALGDQVRRTAVHEPLIELGWPSAQAIKIPPFHSDEISARTAAIWRLIKAADHQPVTHVICVNTARFGGATRMEGDLARMLAEQDGADQVLVVLTDRSAPVPQGKFPKGVRVIDFAALVPDIQGDPRQRILVEFLRALRAKTATNINSRLMWDLMSAYGTALGASMRLYACLFCNEQNPHGHWTGYPLRRVYRHFDQLSGLFTDSEALRADLIRHHRMSPNDQTRLHVLPRPVDPGVPVAAHTPQSRPQLFWAGRFDPQKRVDLVYQIAQACPDIDIRMWGAPVKDVPLPTKPDNVTHEGTYGQFNELPLEAADIWLYTSAWDGVPSMLMEVAMTGVPVVGSAVGGTQEILKDGLSHALPPEASVTDWVNAIRAVLANPEAERQKALKLRTALLEERTPEAMQTAFEKLFQARHET